MQRKNPEKMNKILDVAAGLFSEHGFHDVKLEEVAKLSEVGKGSIYTYFRSKDYLFFRCLSHGLEGFSKEAVDIIKENPFDVGFRRLIAMFVEVVKIKGPLFIVARKYGPKLKITAEEHNEFILLVKQSIDIMAYAFKKGIEEGLLSNNFTPRQMAIFFQGYFDISTAFIFHGEQPLTAEQLYDVFMRAFKTEEDNETE